MNKPTSNLFPVSDRDPEPTLKPDIRLGFVGLTDCAPIAVAHHLGLFEKQGLRVEISREPSWANVRDKLALCMLDAAHLLAPMLLAANLQLDKVSRPLFTSLGLGLGGNGIVLSRELVDRIGLDSDNLHEPLVVSQRLNEWLNTAEGRQQKLRFAAVHPYSTHYYELCLWLAAGGTDPIDAVEMVYHPPLQMPQRLRDGEIAGLCVGEPWATLATHNEAGVLVASGPQLWANKSEKVLAVSEDWGERHPDQHLALITALLEAGLWLDASAENRRQAARWLSEPEWIGQPVEALLPGLSLDPEDTDVPWLRFSSHSAQYPWRSHAAFYLAQMLRWGHIDRAVDVRLTADRSYRPALYRHAATSLGLSSPTIDYLPEGLHAAPWVLAPARPEPITMGPDRFFDGSTFNPFDIAGYLDSLDIVHLRPPMAHLSLVNPAQELPTMEPPMNTLELKS